MFYSVIVAKRVFEKVTFVYRRGILFIFLAVHGVLLTGVILERFLGCKVSKYIESKEIPNLTLDRLFSLDVPLIAPVIAKYALYWTDANIPLKTFNIWSYKALP